jgi:hypothetical protein
MYQSLISDIRIFFLRACRASADEEIVGEPDEIEDRELMFSRFQRLITELMRGNIRRTSFQPWEMELLVDFDQCTVPREKFIGVLRQYHKAVRRQLDVGPGPPMKLSEFLQWRSTRRPSTE